MNILCVNRLKNYLLKIKYRRIQLAGEVKILGKFPSFKLFKNSKCSIGKNVVFNSDFKNSNTALTNLCRFVIGYTGELKIGDNTMFNGVSITAYKRVSIGANCQVASNTFITDTDFHPINPNKRLKQVQGKKYNLDDVNKKDILIGNNVWICWGAIILKGTTIGDNSIVAAGSVVIGSFPKNVIIAGNPGKIVKYLEEDKDE